MLQTSIKSPFVSCHILVTSGLEGLVVQRGGPPLEGWWGLPGGLVEPGETLEHAVKRELVEETGVVLTQRPRLVSIMESIIGEGDGVVHYVSFLYHALSSVRTTPVAGDDAKAARWVTGLDAGRIRLTDMAHRVMRSVELVTGPEPDLAGEFPGGLTVVFHDVVVQP